MGIFLISSFGLFFYRLPNQKTMMILFGSLKYLIDILNVHEKFFRYGTFSLFLIIKVIQELKAYMMENPLIRASN